MFSASGLLCLTKFSYENINPIPTIFLPLINEQNVVPPLRLDVDMESINMVTKVFIKIFCNNMFLLNTLQI
jgi:hypothetical protein